MLSAVRAFLKSRDKQSKNKTLVLRNAVSCLRYEIKTGVVRILVMFQPRPMFSHINGKLSPGPFE